MIKLVFGVLLVAFTSFCGYLLARKFRQRKSFFTQLNVFNERFLSELSYFKHPFLEFAQKYTYNNEFDDALQVFCEHLGTETGRMSNAAGEFCDYSFLKKDEKTFIRDYFLTFGQGDSLSQKNYFSSVASTISAYKSKSEVDAKRYGDLYFKLGFLFGLAVLVLLI